MPMCANFSQIKLIQPILNSMVVVVSTMFTKQHMDMLTNITLLVLSHKQLPSSTFKEVSHNPSLLCTNRFQVVSQCINLHPTNSPMDNKTR